MPSKTIEYNPDMPWMSSRLFFKAEKPGQKELRAAMRKACMDMKLTMQAATYLTWLWLIEVHGGDEQPASNPVCDCTRRGCDRPTCNGQCGCDSCHDDYQEFLSSR